LVPSIPSVAPPFLFLLSSPQFSAALKYKSTCPQACPMLKFVDFAETPSSSFPFPPSLRPMEQLHFYKPVLPSRRSTIICVFLVCLSALSLLCV
jgi:hypothetical protein